MAKISHQQVLDFAQHNPGFPSFLHNFVDASVSDSDKSGFKFKVNGYFSREATLPVSFLPPLSGSILKGKNLLLLEQILFFKS